MTIRNNNWNKKHFLRQVLTHHFLFIGKFPLWVDELNLEYIILYKYLCMRFTRSSKLAAKPEVTWTWPTSNCFRYLHGTVRWFLLKNRTVSVMYHRYILTFITTKDYKFSFIVRNSFVLQRQIWIQRQFLFY